MKRIQQKIIEDRRIEELVEEEGMVLRKEENKRKSYGDKN